MTAADQINSQLARGGERFLTLCVTWNENTSFYIKATMATIDGRTALYDERDHLRNITDYSVLTICVVPCTEVGIEITNNGHSPAGGFTAAVMKLAAWAKQFDPNTQGRLTIQLRSDIIAGLELNCSLIRLSEEIVRNYETAAQAMYSGSTLVEKQ